MSVVKMHYGAPSYSLRNDLVDLQVSVQGGHLTATFDIDNQEVCPYFIAPWWQEHSDLGMPDVIKILRGDFFCLPFGGNADQVDGVKYSAHGEPANRCWDFVDLKEEDDRTDLRLSMDFSHGQGTVDKTIRLYEHEPVIYQENRIRDFSGSSPLGYHPTLQFPPETGSGIIDISKPLAGFVSPLPAGDPAEKGYSLLKPGTEIHDRSAVPCTDGTVLDVSRYPIRRGFVDIVLFMSDPGREFSFTSATFPDQGYIYFQLKDPRVLRSTMFWMSNGGRYSAPWNGRVIGVLGMEEITGFFHYGIKPSLESNFLQNRGYPTSVEIDQAEPLCVKLISGVAAVGKGFLKGVKDIVRKNDRRIVIISKDAAGVEVPCRLDFLAS